MKHTYKYLLLACLFNFASLAEMRVWHLKDGTSFVGEYADEKLNRYYFKDQDGKSLNVPVEDIAPADERYIRSVAPPEVDIRFKKKESMQQGRYADLDTRIIAGTLRITKTDRRPFYGKLTVELYYVGDEFATDDFMMLARKKFTIEFPEEKRPFVEVNLNAETRVYNEYNGIQRRGRTFAGYAAVVLGPSGTVAAFDTDINWLTEDKLDAFRSFPEFTFFGDDCKKRRVPRPQYYSGRGFMP